uniref:Uncharacterized protein n=1 Tax=Cryptomonas curvata TaxID=233186 RepID=A0A7S0QEL3_9CRYP|mmetsp:Transcript_17787/g.37520  ORF Transcript_17787/g.37520 Transcript_17787/m.37520 type:complete len:107 (+) Transcript_17787:28-348(+)
MSDLQAACQTVSNPELKDPVSSFSRLSVSYEELPQQSPAQSQPFECEQKGNGLTVEGVCLLHDFANSMSVAVDFENVNVNRLPPGMLSPAFRTPLRSLRPDRRFRQ